MRHIVAAALALILLTAPAFAQEPAAPTADQILEKYVTALGGRAAIEKITSRVARGSWEAKQGTQVAMGEIELFAKAPNKNGFVLDVDFFGKVRRGFNGTAGWSENPNTGLVDTAGEELESQRREAVFHQALKLRELFPKMTVKGKEKVGERDAWVIEAEPASGRPRKLFFDVESGLLLQSSTQRETQQGVITTSAIFEDYREVDGVKVAFTIKQENPTFPSVIKLADVKHNVPVDDARFEKPAPAAPKP